MKAARKSRGGRRGYRMRVAKKRERQGYEMRDPESGHYATVDPVTNVFLKSSNHPTVQLEVDWYNSDDPSAVEWRKKMKLVTHTPGGRELKFYKYVER